MSTEIAEVEKPTEHPMEEVLELESGTTLVPHKERTTELALSEHYDDKDSEIEGQFQEVYDAAMEAFDETAAESDLIEPKFRARNKEVAVQFLNTALNAAREKSTLKQHKDKVAVEVGKVQNSGKTVNNNLVVADRNELLKMMGKGKEHEGETVEVEAIEDN